MLVVCRHSTKKGTLIQKQNREFPDFNHREPDPPNRTVEDVEAEWARADHDGIIRTIVAGDGACFDQGTKLARARCGAYHGKTHSYGFLFKMEGPAQSSDRAELRCLSRVVWWACVRTEDLTDNQAVQLCHQKLL